jgi:hypothetical protein
MVDIGVEFSSGLGVEFSSGFVVELWGDHLS